MSKSQKGTLSLDIPQRVTVAIASLHWNDLNSFASPG